MKPHLVKLSKFLSLVLRHEPESIGLRLDEQGWADVEELLRCCQAGPQPMTREELEEVVRTNDKKRFAFSPDGTKIRANQGHSIEVNLALEPREPPELLYHGTAQRHLDSIRQSGIHKGERHHVHLSLDEPTAIKVGQRHGKPVVLTIRAGEMHKKGNVFYCSDNGVWLTEHVPPEFISFP
jgi:putative RNA 2'-phosphotransferase